MTELLNKLSSVYHSSATETVTPARIQRATKDENEWTADDVYNNLDSAVVESKFTSHHGNLKIKQKERFVHDASRLIKAGYKPQNLIKIDENCVNKNGTINEEELHKLLNDILKLAPRNSD